MKFKRFTKPQFLREIGRPLLREFLDRFKGDGPTPKITLPDADLEDEPFFKALAALFVEPDPLPGEMIDALYAVEELASESGQERLETAREQGTLALDWKEDATRAEMAVQAWMAAPEVVRQVHNELTLGRVSSFEYFGAAEPEDPKHRFAKIEPKRLGLFAGDCDDWFKEHNRGKGTTDICLHEIDGEFWFMVRHGDTFLRTAKVDGGKLAMLHFRPAKDDVVVYSPERDEIRIHAGTKGEKEMYRTVFGTRLFGNPDHFSLKKGFTLEPLRTLQKEALDLDGLDGIDKIVLRELEMAWGTLGAVTIWKAEDLFLAAEARKRAAVPDAGKLVRAAFDFYFTGSNKPRKVHLRPWNTLKLGRHCDAALVQRWISKKEFREADPAAKPLPKPATSGLAGPLPPPMGGPGRTATGGADARV